MIADFDAGGHWFVRIEDNLERIMNGGVVTSSGGGGGRSAPRIRIPDPGAWKLRILKGRQDNFKDWRNEVEMQLGSVWM